MNRKLVKRAFEIVDDAIILSAVERGVYLDQACGEDPDLRAEVESILQHEVGLSIAPADSDDLRPDFPDAFCVADRYELHEEIARGGMGVILRATDRQLDREVAVKIMLESQAGNADAARRFANEARIAARLQHPAIPPVHDLGRLDDGRPLLAMKLVRGQTLASLLSSREPGEEPSFLLTIFDQVCQTIAFAHSHNVIHRDLKPDNVMVGQFGEVQVMDWGLAKEGCGLEAVDCRPQEEEGGRREAGDYRSEREPAADLLNSSPSAWSPASGLQSPASFDTRAGTVMGTPAYMPPEQAIGRRDKTTDVFALGAILCEILSGAPPYTGTSPIELFEKSAGGQLDEAFKRLDGTGYDPQLIQLTKKCLAKTPDERFSDACELATAFSGYMEFRRSRLREAEIGMARAQAVALEERRRRRVTLALAASVVTVAALGLGGGMWVSWQRAQYEKNVANVEREASARAEAQLYRNTMEAAFHEFESQGYPRAWEMLHDAPKRLRNWEWHYLRGRIDRSLRLFNDRINNVLLAGLVRGTDMLRTVDTDGTARLWHRWTGSEVEVRRVDYGKPIALGPEGNLVLSSGEVPILWDARTGEVLHRFDASLGVAVHLSAISRGGLYVAIHTRDGALNLIETEEGKLLHSFPDSRCKPQFSLDGAWLAWRDHDSIRFWDALENREPRPPLDLGSSDGFQRLAISPDRTYVAWRNGKQIRLWNLETGDHNALHPVPDTVDELMFNDAGTRLVSTLVDGAIQLWETATGQLLDTLRSPSVSMVHSQAISCEGRLLMTHPVRPEWQEIRLWDLEGNDSLTLNGHTSFVYPVAVSPDGQRIASGAWDGTVRLWDAETSEEIAVLGPSQGAAIYSLAFDSRGERLVAGTADHSILVWNQATGQLVDRIELTDKCYSLAFTPHDARLVVAHGGLTVLDGMSLMPHRTLVPQHFPGEKDHVTEVVFSASGDSFVTFSGKSTWAPGREVTVWDVSTLEQLAVFQTPTPIHTAIYSPDGDHLALGHSDGQITVWDLADFAQPVCTIHAHHREIFALQYLRDGSRLISGGKDGKIRIWDMQSHRQLGVLGGHTDYVYSLALGPDGQRLVSGAGDQTVRIWETFPLSRRLDSKREAESLRPQAEQLVDQLMAEESDASRVAERIKEDGELSTALCRESLNAVLRLAIGEPSS